MEQILNPNLVKGYTKLPKQSQKTFDSFLPKFYMAQGTESRESIIPKSVKLAKEDSWTYIRFDYEINSKANWMHVLKNGAWY